MSFIRDNKTTSLLVHLAGMFIAREAGRGTLITPTRAEISRDHKHVTIFVSVFPTEHKDDALAFLLRRKDDFRDFLKKESRLGRLPFITFEFDYGEANRQHLDEITPTNPE